MAKHEKKESFEQALSRLEEITEHLEKGDLALDESLRKYEEGVAAYRYCASLLAEVERKIEILTKDGEGVVVTADAGRLAPAE